MTCNYIDSLVLVFSGSSSSSRIQMLRKPFEFYIVREFLSSTTFVTASKFFSIKAHYSCPAYTMGNMMADLRQP